MDTANFLATVVAPGNFMAISINRSPNTTGGFFVRLFARDDVAGAVSLAAWGSKQGFDVYHSNASFMTAEPDGTDKYTHKPKFKATKGARGIGNVQNLKAFWLDLDVARPGDGKDLSTVFSTQAAALGWVAGFYQAAGLPKPNLFVSSGYGVHVYWVLEEPMSAASWTPYAERLKAAALAQGFTGDVSVIADAARILRVAGTTNNKVVGVPAPVAVIDQLTSSAIPNTLMLAALGKHGVQAAARPTVIGGSVSALAGQTASVTLLSAAQKHAGMGAAAASGAQSSRPRYMANIVPQCLQIGKSLANNGNGDPYPLWYLGNLSLAHFCADGSSYVHPLSSGDPRYTAANVDTHVTRIAHEHAIKNHGPPSCASFNGFRAGVCTGCPHWGKITTPWSLGLNNGDLPAGYRRENGNIEYMRRAKDNEWWEVLLYGDVHSPLLNRTPLGVVLSFVHTRNGEDVAVQAEDYNLSAESSAMRRIFGRQSVTLDMGLEGKFSEFLVSWIQELRRQNNLRPLPVAPFGWHIENGNHVGFAVAGELYTQTGATERVAGGDRQIHEMYQPSGSLTPWKQAAAVVVNGKPQLATIVGVTFGAPLLKLTGQSGMVVSAWSRSSGVGKSAAMTVGQGAWSKKEMMTATNDTANSIARKAGEGRVMPVYWDETLVGNNNTADFVSLVFQMAQGKERSRLNAEANMRETGTWNTIICTAGNKPLMDVVVQETEATPAGALRLFEYEIPEDQQPNDPGATSIITQAETNYGHAGREYARWLAVNHDAAKQAVFAAMEGFTKELGARRDERLYIAGMASIYVGASIASMLGLVAFQLPSLREFLCQTFISLRAARVTSVLVNELGYDLKEILGRFMSAHSPQTIVTQYFTHQGNSRGAPLAILAAPNANLPAVVQISAGDKLMRIDRASFNVWARKHKLPGPDIVRSMKLAWNGDDSRRNKIGGGTPFSGGQVMCLELSLSHPDLQIYIPDVTTSSVSALHTPPPAMAATP